MTSWADERRQGTDELLLTLPAHDLDVVLGKYLAALGIFTVALAFSMSHLLVLQYLGGADIGVMFSTYLGYWLMGVLLIAVGMVASLLSANVTVAFIFGALLCAIPVFLDWFGTPTSLGLRRQIEQWSVPAQFRDFGTGVISLSGLFYFISLAVAMLYLNMVLLGRRHWAGGEASKGLWVHSLVRFLAVLVALFSLSVMIQRVGARKDVSSEQMHTLSPESADLIKQIPDDKPVLIQAYYSPEVPREYIETKSDLLGLLREYEARSRGKIHLNLVPTELYSEAAREAEKRFAIEPKRVASDDQAKRMLCGDLPGSRIHLGTRGSGHPVLRPRPAGGVRADPVDPRGVADRPAEGRHPQHRRQDDGGLRHSDLRPDARVVDRHRAEEAVRGELGRRRLADRR